MATFEAIKLKAKNSMLVTIRTAIETDAEDILHVSKSVIDEEIFQLMTSSEFSLTSADEKLWINSFTAKPLGILLVAECQGKVVGLLDFHIGHRERISHVGDFAISVLKEFRGISIGSFLLQRLISWAQSTGKIEKINLQVHSTNQQAIQTYLKNGFTVEGVRKKELKYADGNYVDAVLMTRFI